ncbi:MAG: tyrosine-type recombinase/integrase [Ruminococcus sp.]|nr:tyrosine-type recombinase/integrase [Ruminococcus sp.]
MRLPNGYGSITKLSGNRRKPYIVRITTGYDDEGRQLRKILGYYATRKAALEALAAYSENPYDIDASKITFSQLYDKWSAEKYNELSPSAVRTYKSAYSYCKPLYDIRITDIRTIQMQDIVDHADVEATTRARIQSLFRLMFKFAMKYDYIKKDYSEFVKRPKIEVEKERVPFSYNEVKRLWELSDVHTAQIVLIMIYTGWRSSELSLMTFENGIDVQHKTMQGGIKTEAGKNRLMPICDKIFPFVEQMYTSGFSGISSDENGESLNYNQLYRKIIGFFEEYDFNHIPYETRHTFATMLDNKNINAKIKKLLLGHSSNDVTEKVYTHKTIEQLREAVNSL